jgi:hypothetical protein
MKEAPGSSEMSVLTRATRRNNPEDTILHSHRRENLKSYIYWRFCSGTRVFIIPKIKDANWSQFWAYPDYIIFTYPQNISPNLILFGVPIRFSVVQATYFRDISKQKCAPFIFSFPPVFRLIIFKFMWNSLWWNEKELSVYIRLWRH